MKRHAVTALCLLGAVVCYFAGWGEGIIPLAAAGVVLELVFWARLVGLPGSGKAGRR